MKQESLITLRGTTLKIGPWQAPTPEIIQDLVVFYQVIKTEKATYEATLTLKFHHDQMPQKGVQLYDQPFPIDFHKNLPTFLREFEATKQDKAPYKLEYDMATFAQEERLFAATRQAFWNTHFQDVINPLLEIQVQGKIGKIWLCVSSQEAFVRNLPWELMLRPYMAAPNSSQQIPKLTIVRTTCANLQDFGLQPQPKAERQLKLLFVTALPERLEERHKLLQVEYEQKRLIESLSEQDQGIVEIDFAELASLEEIDALLTEGKHHILHISGHGDFKQPNFSPDQAAAAASNLPETIGLLVLEDEDGNRVDTSGQELGAVLKKHDSLQLVVMSNCNSGKAGAHGLTEEVAAQGIPVVIGMRFTMTDHAAMEFTTALYSELAKGKSLAEGFRNGQDALYWNPDADGKRYEDTEWFTPVLFSRQVMGAIVDVELAKNASSEKLATKLKAQADHLGTNFIGRRRYLAKIKRILEGPGHLCLYGMKGIGKSALARVAARNYAGENVVVVSEPQDMQSHFEQGEKAVVIVEVLDHHNAGYWRMVGELLDREFGPKVIVVSYHSIKFFGDQVEAMAVWKLSYAEQWRLVEQSAAFGRWRPQDERPSLEDLEEIFDKLDGHLGAIRLLEKAIAGYQGNDYADEITRQLPLVLSEVQSHLSFDEITEEVKVLIVKASVFFDASPLGALVAVTGEPEEVLRENLASAQLWGWCFFDGEVFEVQMIAREWIMKAGLLQVEMRKRVAMRAGEWFEMSMHYWSHALEYFEIASEWHLLTKLAIRLQAIYLQLGNHRKAKSLFEVLIEKVLDPLDVAAIQNALGEIYLGLGELENALRCFEQSGRSLLENECEVDGLVLNNISQVFHSRGDLASALSYLQKSQQQLESSRNYLGLSTAFYNIGQIHKDKGEFQEALENLNKSLIISRHLQYKVGEARALATIGKVHSFLGHSSEAMSYMLQGLELDREIMNLGGEANTLRQLGELHFGQKNTTIAMNLFERCLEIEKAIGDNAGIGKVMSNIGLIYKYLGNSIAAMTYLETGLQFSKEAGDIATIGAISSNIGSMYFDKGDFDHAMDYLEIGLEISRNTGRSTLTAQMLINISQILIKKGDHQSARQYIEDGISLLERAGDRSSLGGALINLAGILYHTGDNMNSLKHLNDALQILVETKNRAGEAQALSSMGEIHTSLKNYADARYCLQKAFKIQREIGSLLGESITLYKFGRLLYNAKQLEQSMPFLMASYLFLSDLNDPMAHHPKDLLNLVYIELGDIKFMQIMLSFDKETLADRILDTNFDFPQSADYK